MEFKDVKVGRECPNYYRIRDYYRMESEGNLHILSKFPTYYQTEAYSCGAASTLMVLKWFGEEEYNETIVGGGTGTDRERGTGVAGIAEFFKNIGWDIDYHDGVDDRFASLEEFVAYAIEAIDSNMPILVNWLDWGGHWQVLIGIELDKSGDPNDAMLIFADPSRRNNQNKDGYYAFPAGRFFSMWREGDCRGRIPLEQPFVLVKGPAPVL